MVLPSNSRVIANDRLSPVVKRGAAVKPRRLGYLARLAVNSRGSPWPPARFILISSPETVPV